LRTLCSIESQGRLNPSKIKIAGAQNGTQAYSHAQLAVSLKSVSVDQVEFMRSILEPSELLRWIEIYVEEEVRAERLPKGTFPLLREGLLAGEFERRTADSITGYGERMARSVVSKLVERGLLVSSSPKGPLRLGFPLAIVERWFPSLYPANRT
jgi:hypothetical protein